MLVLVVGLLVIAAGVVCIVLASFASFASRRWARYALAAAALLFWLPAVLAFGGLLAFEAGDTHESPSLDCVLPTDNSAWAPSHWSWLPPGEVCEYPAGDEGPTLWRIPAAIGLLAIPAVGLFRAVKGVRSHVALVTQEVV